MKRITSNHKGNHPVSTRKENKAQSLNRPDHYTLISFYINLSISIYFVFWDIMMLLALNNVHVIEKYKQLPVLEIIDKRGIELGFEQGAFQEALNQYHVIALCLFIPIALGIFFIWKKRTAFYPLIMIPALLQILIMVILMGPSYIWNDLTAVDKVLYLLFLVNSSIYFGLLRMEKQNGSISFFGED